MSINLSADLEARGLIKQFSAPKLSDILDGENKTFYLGIDPSADSLHVGNLLPILFVRRLIEVGHKGIILVGGGTGMIGDPSGKSEERVLLDETAVAMNAKSQERQIEKLMNGHGITLVNNLDWLRNLSLIAFLRDVGKHFSVNAMLAKDSVKTRLQNEETGISYTEFSYALLQSYDFLHLFDNYKCSLQVGGSDQWGNITSGIDLVRRLRGSTVHGVTIPLLVNKKTGKKFGKTEEGAVWLDPEKTSIYKFYQFWFNTDDEDTKDYLKLFTFLSLSEIEDIIAESTQNPSARIAQKRLAYEVTAMVHGKSQADSASHISELVFGEKNLSEISAKEREMVIGELPGADIREEELPNITVEDLLVLAKLSESKNEARRLTTAQGVSIGGERVEVGAKIEKTQFTDNLLIIKKGKREVAYIHLV